MNLTSEQIKVILEVAKMLQGQYTAIGAPVTQNVRNVQPMHRIITSLLPNHPSAAIASNEIHAKILALGFRASKNTIHDTISRLNRAKKIHAVRPSRERLAEIRRTSNTPRGASRTRLYYVRG